VVIRASLSKLATPAKLGLAAALVSPLFAFTFPAAQLATATITVGGTVTADGHAMAGMTVTFRAWPDQAVVQSMKIGEKVPFVVVGTATTSANGTYAASLPLPKLRPEASYGVVNVEAYTKTAEYTFPIVVSKNNSNAYLAGPAPVVNLTRSNYDPCAGAIKTYVASLGKRWAVVGEPYVPTSHATQQFTYMKGQSSSLGIGVSVTGGAGTFTQDTTYSWSSTFKEPWPAYGANRSVWYITQFHWGEYSCYVPHIGTTGFEQHVNGYAGGADIRKPTSVPPTPSRFCVFQIKGSAPTSNTSSAVTWTRKLSIAAVSDDAALGFDASAQTGFDTSAQLTYKVSANRYLCGWKDNPGGVPKQLVIRP